jgi:hypothetical protein
MSIIKNFKNFCLNESDDLYFRRHLGDNSSNYVDRSKKYYGLGDDASVLQKTESFFDRMEDRFNRASDIYQNKVNQNRASRPFGGPDTGFEILSGTASLIPNLLKRVFGPTKYDFSKSKREDIDVDLIRHTNNDFIRNELPSIRTEDDLASHIEGLYGRGGVNVGSEPVLDDIARNRANLYYQRQNNPNSPVLRPVQVNN